MKKLARLFLLCMMILAIPVQGVAAATMLYCGSEHHQALVSDQDQCEQHGHDHHDAAEKSLHHSSYSDTAAKLSKDKCSSCAACCIGAAMVTESRIPNSPSPSSEKIDLVFSSQFGHISDGLERPPRT